MSDLASAITNTVNGAVNSAVNAANAAVDSAINAADVGIAQINAALTGPAVIDFAYGKNLLNAPVGPGVVINLPSNTNSQLALAAPLQFHGTINLNVPGYAPNGQPSLVALIGVGADHWSFSTSTNTLTLFAGSQVTDTLSLAPSAAGFWVYAAPATVGAGLPGGVVITSPALAGTPPLGAVALPGTVGA
ncbi:MAG: hypothetical protein JO118_17600 [Acetobacteraceae bacterium]|nr:hypothetical protein [Acetobacteraceae bacterium]